MDGRIRILSNPMTSHDRVQSLQSWVQNNMAVNQSVVAVLDGLISSLITCVQLNVAMSTVHVKHTFSGNSTS